MSTIVHICTVAIYWLYVIVVIRILYPVTTTTTIYLEQKTKQTFCVEGFENVWQVSFLETSMRKFKSWMPSWRCNSGTSLVSQSECPVGFGRSRWYRDFQFVISKVIGMTNSSWHLQSALSVGFSKWGIRVESPNWGFQVELSSGNSSLKLRSEISIGIWDCCHFGNWKSGLCHVGNPMRNSMWTFH